MRNTLDDLLAEFHAILDRHLDKIADAIDALADDPRASAFSPIEAFRFCAHLVRRGKSNPPEAEKSAAAAEPTQPPTQRAAAADNSEDQDCHATYR